MNLIANLLKFEKLYLVWQTAKDKRRIRYTVAILHRNPDSSVTFKYLPATLDFQSAKKLGFEGYPAFAIEQREHTVGVLDAFMRRLPPRSRGDFNQYLDILRLPHDLVIDDFSLLGYSGAKLPSDDFSIIPDFSVVRTPFQFMMEIAGFKKFSEISRDDLELSTQVQFEKDLKNEIDHNAIQIKCKDKMLGYVPRTILKEFNQWIDTKRLINAKIARKNGPLDKPVAYLFVEVDQYNP